MLLAILLSLAAIVAVFLIVASRQPENFTVRRSATMGAQPETIFAKVNDFHEWEAWSPWAKMDPSAKNSFSGAKSGPGAGFAWDGNKKVGAGRMEILESRAPEFIRLELNFRRPFKATNLAEFTFQPQGGGTLVAWSMTGKRNLGMKASGMLVDCDKMVGKDFEQGLANLQAVTDGASGRPAQPVSMPV